MCDSEPKQGEAAAGKGRSARSTSNERLQRDQGKAAQIPSKN